MDGRRESRRVYSRHRLPGVLAETEKSLVKGFFHLFLAMFIVGELLTYVWSREGCMTPCNTGLHRHLY